MPERPVILFPTPERAGRSQKTPVFKNYRRPSFDRQYNRLQPTFQSLRTAFEQKSIAAVIILDALFGDHWL